MEQMAKKEYSIKPISEEFSDKAIQFLADYFIGHDPITQCLLKDADKSELLDPSYMELNKNTIKQGHSVMAVTSVGEIVGLLINQKLENQIASTNPMLQQLIESLNAKMNEKVNGDNALLIRIGVVHPNFNKKGIAKAMVLQTIQDAKRKGFDQLRTHCINAYFAKLSESCGFEYIESVAYEDFKPDGVIVFKPTLPHTHVHGMILQLNT